MESEGNDDIRLHQRILEEGGGDHSGNMSRDQETEAEQLLDMEEEDEQPPASTPVLPAATLDQGQQAIIVSPPATQFLRPVPPPERDCTYIAINKFRMSDRVAPNLMGGDLLMAGDCGSLYGTEDNRQILCFTRFDFGKKQNLMFSFNPDTMMCSCCASKVFYKRGNVARAEPRTIILSDQNFPASLPAISNCGLQCLKIIRLEFASLWELNNIFLEILRKEDLQVPTGSTILIGSASHLSNVGISAYAEELSAVCRRLNSFFNGSIYCLPCPFIMCAPCTDPELVRATAELVSWLGNILGREVNYTPVAMELCARKILESDLPTAPSSSRRLLLPVSLTTPLKKKWAVSASNLPSGACAASSDSEQEIVGALLNELNARLALYLDTKVSFDRNPAAPATRPERFIVVGASHASRTADCLSACGASVVKLTVPGWRITRPKVADMAVRLKDALVEEGEECTVIYEMFDSNFFLARTEEGGLVPICKRAAGGYHVDGDLVFAPKELQHAVFCDAKPLLEAAGNRRRIIVSPIPRYLLLGCCEDPAHVGNLSNKDYRAGLEAAVFECRKNIKDFCFTQGIRNVRVVGPWPALKALGDEIWMDQVHLTPQGYSVVANLVMEAVADLGTRLDTGGRSDKRPRDDSDGGGDFRRSRPFYKSGGSWQPRGASRY